MIAVTQDGIAKIVRSHLRQRSNEDRMVAPGVTTEDVVQEVWARIQPRYTEVTPGFVRRITNQVVYKYTTGRFSAYYKKVRALIKANNLQSDITLWERDKFVTTIVDLLRSSLPGLNTESYIGIAQRYFDRMILKSDPRHDQMNIEMQYTDCLPDDVKNAFDTIYPFVSDEDRAKVMALKPEAMRIIRRSNMYGLELLLLAQRNNQMRDEI